MRKIVLHILLYATLCMIHSCEQPPDDIGVVVLNNSEKRIMATINHDYPKTITEVVRDSIVKICPQDVGRMFGYYNSIDANTKEVLILRSTENSDRFVIEGTAKIAPSRWSREEYNIHLAYPEDFTTVDFEIIVPITGAFDGKTNL